MDTLLHEAAGHFQTFKVIMDLVKEKSPPDAFGLTPLHLAAQYNHLEICTGGPRLVRFFGPGKNRTLRNSY